MFPNKNLKQRFSENLIIDTIRSILGWVMRLGIIGFALILLFIGVFFS